MVTLSLLSALLVAGLVFFVMYRADRNRNTPLPWLSAGLRALLSFLLVLLILAPQIQHKIVEEQKPLVLFLQDNSESVDRALGNNKSTFAAKRQQLLSRLAKDFRVVSWNLDGPCPIDSLNRYRAAITNLGKPLDDAISQFYRQHLSATIVASDGRVNEGNNPVYCNFPLNSFVYSLALGDTTQRRDVRVSKLYANKTVSLNSEWELLADIVGEHLDASEIEVSLTDEQGRELGTATVRSQGGSVSKQIAFVLKAQQEGLRQYTVKVKALAGEANTANNRNNIIVEVAAQKKKILLSYAAPHPDIKAISAALQGHKQYELDVREVTDLPATPEAYAAVILHQLPAPGKSVPSSWTQGKNVWYIAGAQNNYAELNKCQQILRFTPGAMRSGIQVLFNKSFNLFNPPPDLAAVADQLPPLQVSGDVSLTGPAEILFSEAEGKPLWLLTNSDPALAITAGEGLWRWRLYEFKNFGKQQSLDECIVQTLNLLSNTNRSKRLQVESTKNDWSNGEQIIFSARLHNAAGEAVNSPEVSFQLKDSNGMSQKFVFERSSNRYRLNIGALAPGAYSYTASTNFEGKLFSDAGRFFVSESNIESLESGCNYRMMADLARRNRGAIFMPEQMDALYDSIKRNTAIKPLLSERQEPVALISQSWIFFLILTLATTEWLLRKYWMAM